MHAWLEVTPHNPPDAQVRHAVFNVFYYWGLPTLALPFCLTTLPFLVNHKCVPVDRSHQQGGMLWWLGVY